MSGVDEAQCLCCLALGLDESRWVPTIVQEKFLSSPSYLVVTLSLDCNAYR
jgi:hypothetical protein